MRHRILIFTFLFFGFSVSTTRAEELVKMSSSNMCHSASSPYYDRLKNFTPYQSMARCLASGGQQAKSSESGKSAKKDSSTYERSDFGRGWADFDETVKILDTKSWLKNLRRSKVGLEGLQCNCGPVDIFLFR